MSFKIENNNFNRYLYYLKKSATKYKRNVKKKF